MDKTLTERLLESVGTRINKVPIFRRAIGNVVDHAPYYGRRYVEGMYLLGGGLTGYGLASHDPIALVSGVSVCVINAGVSYAIDFHLTH